MASTQTRLVKARTRRTALRRSWLGWSTTNNAQDLDEIFSICDRIAVIYQGTLSDARPIRDVTVEEIGLLMGGAHPEARKAASHAHPA